jgi:hypothetical protein
MIADFMTYHFTDWIEIRKITLKMAQNSAQNMTALAFGRAGETKSSGICSKMIKIDCIETITRMSIKLDSSVSIIVYRPGYLATPIAQKVAHSVVII